MHLNENKIGAVIFAIGAALCVFIAPVAYADRADRDKPINIEADRMIADNAKKIATFEGRAVLTQGTLVIRADKIIVRQDESGFQYGTATGHPATFRQKREGSEEFFDGDALRIEYNGKTELVEFFDNAHLHRDGGDDVRGNYILFNQKTEFFTVKSSSDPKQDNPSSGSGSRVTATIMPKKKEDPAQPPAPSPAIGAPNAPASDTAGPKQQ